MIHTDTADYAAVLDEVARVLEPGGVFVHIGVHPCFCGDFADRGDVEAIVIRPGYLDAGWTPAIAPTAGRTGRDGQVRMKVGAAHMPLAALVNLFHGRGLLIEELFEGWSPTPITLSLRARRASA
jgi:hypothetical protein